MIQGIFSRVCECVGGGGLNAILQKGTFFALISSLINTLYSKCMKCDF